MAAVDVSHETAPPTPRRVGVRFFRNPVVIKELRGRMRGMRAFVVLTVYLTLMSGFVTLLYVLNASWLSNPGSSAGANIGRLLFAGIVGTELFLVTFIAPTFTAGAISGERERQTYDLLRTTLLPARSLVLGKLVSALSYVFLLLLAAIPLQSIAFLFGGVTEAEVLLSFVILLVTAITLGSVGIYFSSYMQRTLSASIMTYGVALFATLGLPLIVFIIATLMSPLIGAISNSSQAVQTVLVYGLGILICTNPLATAFVTEQYLITNQPIGVFSQSFMSAGKPFQLTLISPWIVFSVLYLTISAILVVMSIRRVRRIEK
jgi:ABC-2 type transport system permease protein